jgi:hypothetical protein
LEPDDVEEADARDAKGYAFGAEVERKDLAEVGELDVVHPFITCYVDCRELVGRGEGRDEAVRK